MGRLATAADLGLVPEEVVAPGTPTVIHGGADEEKAVLDDPPDPKKIQESLTFFPSFFGPLECANIEAWLDDTEWRGMQGLISGPRTIDRTPNRTKYFFGHGYSYGRGMRGREELLPAGSVAPIPDWVRHFVIWPLEMRGVTPPGWIDSVVINDYRAGSSIVAHVDPIRLFARPIVTATFFCPAHLVFGASFDPVRRTPPAHAQMLTRGSVLMIDGYAANNVTHGIRPEDIMGPRRVSLVLRHVMAEAVQAPLIKSDQDVEMIGRLTKKAQGLWRSPASASVPTKFYVVRGLTVTVLAPTQDVEDNDSAVVAAMLETVAVGKGGPRKLCKWQLVPVDDGLICNGGLLDESNAWEQSLRWRVLRSKLQPTCKQQEDGEQLATAETQLPQPPPFYTWLRVGK